MEDRDQNISSILKHIKGLRKDIREMRKSMDSASKMVFTNQEIMEQLDVSTAVLKKMERLRPPRLLPNQQQILLFSQ